MKQLLCMDGKSSQSNGKQSMSVCLSVCLITNTKWMLTKYFVRNSQEQLSANLILIHITPVPPTHMDVQDLERPQQ
jgi:hypothetical protein